MDDDRGTSLVLTNTGKGVLFFERICAGLDCVSATFAEAVAGNSALVKSPLPHRNRGRFLRHCQAADFDRSVDLMLRLPFISQMRMFAGKLLRRIGLRK